MCIRNYLSELFHEVDTLPLVHAASLLDYSISTRFAIFSMCPAAVYWEAAVLADSVIHQASTSSYAHEGRYSRRSTGKPFVQKHAVWLLLRYLSMLLLRAIVNHPELLILDEPFELAGAESSKKIANYLTTLQNTTCFVVSGYVPFAQQADLIIWLEKGSIKHIGEPNSILPLVIS